MGVIGGKRSRQCDLGVPDNYGGLYRDTGIGSFVLRYGVRKLKSRGNVQTRVLEVNFIDKVVYITKRGQIIESSPFSGVSNVSKWVLSCHCGVVAET